MIDDFCITKNWYTAVRSFLISMNYMLIETTYTLIDELYDGHRFLSCWLVPVSGASQWKGLVLSIYVLTLARVENSMNQLQFKLASHVFIEVLAILGDNLLTVRWMVATIRQIDRLHTSIPIDICLRNQSFASNR